MAEDNAKEITTVFKADISQFTQSTQQLNRYVATVNAEFKNATASMDRWNDNADGLTAKIRQLNGVLAAEKTKLDAIQKEYDETVQKQGANSKAAQELYIKLNQQQAKVKDTEKQINYYTKSLNELTAAGVSTKQELDALNKSTEKQGVTFKTVASTALKGFAAGVVAIGAAAVATASKIFSLTKQVATAGDEIDKESQKLGITAESYQKLSYAMEISGANIGDLTKGIRTITTELANAEKGVSGAGKVFTDLGIELKNTNGTFKSTEDVLLESIDLLAKMENETQRNAIAQDIFGRQAAELKPLLNTGAEGIKDLMNEATEYNMIMSDDAVKASASFADSLTKLKGTFNGVKNSMLSTLLPSFTSIINGLSDLIAGVKGAGEQIKTGVTNVINDITKLLPKVTSFISTIVDAVLESAPNIIQALADGILNALPSLINTILTALPSLTSLVIDIVNQLLNLLEQLLPQILATITKLLPQIINLIIAAIPQFIKATLSIVQAIVKELPTIINNLIDALPSIINTIINVIINSIPLIVTASIQLFNGIIKAIPYIISELIEQLPTIITSIVTGLIEGIPQLIKAGGELLAGLFEGMLNPKVIWDNVKLLWNSIGNAFKNIFSKNNKTSLSANITPFANGGIIDKPTLAMVGEAGKEAIVPLENNTEWLDKLADRLSGKMGRNTVNNFNYTFEKMETTKLALHKANLETKRVLGGI